MSDPMLEIRASFFVECEELLEALQDALQSMSDGANDSETINVAFRAVHSIKGGAGAFGLDQLVSFTHSFETAMDEARSDRLEIGREVIALFFQCADALSDLVRAAREETTLSNDALEGLLGQLTELVGGKETGDAEDAPTDEDLEFQPTGISLDLPGLELPNPETGDPRQEGDTDRLASEDLLRPVGIRFAPTPELYSSGNEPVFLLTALAGFGNPTTACTISTLPDLETYDGTVSLLSWDVTLETSADRDILLDIFDFVDGLCDLKITDPGEQPTETAPQNQAERTENVETPQRSEAVISAAKPEAAKASPPPKEHAPKEPEKTAQSVQPQSSPAATVRVDLDRIDRLVNLVGELVINQAMLAQSFGASGLSGNTKIASGLDEFQQLTRDIQDSVMMIRAQPVKSLFQRMARIVRESSADVGKTVRLVTEGEATEIDKTVIERLADPLTHMIRNAVDHGLEKTEDREAAGKPAEGIVTLTAAHRSGRVLIEVADDGGGINRARVKAIAEDKGLIPPGQELSDGEIDNLLFLPGFSTASSVSNISGRGVGMDVVKNAIGALGGRISILSETGIGTTFSISLPLTLAVLDGMVVRVRSETLVVPLSAISETLSLKKTDARPLGPSTQVVRVRDSFVPLIDLGAELGYSTPRENYEGAIVLLISHEDGDRAALVVDEIEDQRQVVIKGLQDSYGHVPGVAAATILGDGQIALILDPADLLANATGHSRPALVATGTG
ncbi:MAG: chemotaxis protein CheA [Pseudomonadota bacterium]